MCERAEAESNRGSSYQPNAVPLGQTDALSRRFPSSVLLYVHRNSADCWGRGGRTHRRRAFLKERQVSVTSQKKVKLQEFCKIELRLSCVKLETDFLDSPALIVLMVSVDVKQN